MKYINQLNWILVIAAGVVVVYALVSTYWSPEAPGTGSIEIPKASPVRSQDAGEPAQGAPRPNSNSSQSPSVQQPGSPGVPQPANPSSAGVTSSSGQNPVEPVKPVILIPGSPPRLQDDRAVEPTARVGEITRPPQAAPTPRYDLTGPPPTAPGAAKRSPGTDPTHPPIRSSMPEQRPY